MPYFKYHLPDRHARQQEDRVNELRDACRLRGLTFRIAGQEAAIRDGSRTLFAGPIAEAVRWCTRDTGGPFSG